MPGETVTDVNGHGTHVASTVAGTGAASDGKEKGVAPGADLAIGKVLNDAGSGAESWIIEGMEWGAGTRRRRLDEPGQPGGQRRHRPDGPRRRLAQRVDAARCSSSRPATTAGSAASARPAPRIRALTVGAVDGADERAYFQDMGPRLGDAVVKPEIVAPGVDVLAARSSASERRRSLRLAVRHVDGHPARRRRSRDHRAAAPRLDRRTDQATPWSARPSRWPARRRTRSAAAGSTSRPRPSATSSPPRASSSATTPGRTTTTPRSTGRSPTPTSPTPTSRSTSPRPSPPTTCSPAPDGLVTLSGRPGHGARRRHGRRDGHRYAGPPAQRARRTPAPIVASAGGEQVAQTAVGLVKEEERYDLEIRALDRKGKPTGGFVTLYRYGDQYVSTLELDPATGTVADPAAAARRLQRHRAGCRSTPTAAASRSWATPTSWSARPTRR